MPYAPKLKESASQTAGPYVHIGCMPNTTGIHTIFDTDLGSTMFTGEAKGERINIEAVIFDGSGTPVKDAMVEIWQADANGVFASPEDGREADPHFTGFGRQHADHDTGVFRFETIKPGAVSVDGKTYAPHVLMWIAARGINLALATRVYFDDEAEANEADPFLSRIELKSRVPTLIAKRDGNTYRHEIHLQGPDETVFFDL
ncbi:protocatechuate 3,4-dioxygenase subunit alpha [Marivivens aquimaris]|uniref:protocatechuate 3,4-dioxygenase subunit alpha n=1 Tax=Marivivens aquimaris TaxID=2774876 RepID=UPI0018811F2F|nr:protocatechuate 3,4-dioxygenase subunit alpha [Marivivens aquimaris]